MIHGATQSATWMSLFSGQTVVLAPEFDADEVWRMIHEHKVNLLFFTGDAMARPLLDALLAHQEKGDDVRPVSACSCSPAPRRCSRPASRRSCSNCCPTAIITDSIGSSETGFGGTSVVAKGQSHTGGPRVTIDKNTVVLDEDGNEVVPGSGVRGVIAKRGHIPVGYFKDAKKTAETFRTFHGVRYAIPGDYARGRGRRQRHDARPWLGVHQQRRREDLPRRGRGRAQGPPRRVRRARGRRARPALRPACRRRGAAA